MVHQMGGAVELGGTQVRARMLPQEETGTDLPIQKTGVQFRLLGGIEGKYRR